MFVLYVWGCVRQSFRLRTHTVASNTKEYTLLATDNSRRIFTVLKFKYSKITVDSRHPVRQGKTRGGQINILIERSNKDDVVVLMKYGRGFRHPCTVFHTVSP